MCQKISVLGTDPKEISEDELFKCGVNYCPAPAAEPSNVTIDEEEEASKDDNFSASKTQTYLLAGVYLFFSLLSAVVVALVVDPLSM